MNLLFKTICALALSSSFKLCAADSAKPNIVIILADDMGYGDLSCYGATKLKTPNIDKLAAEGMRFTHAYTPGSVCSPTRYGLLAGRYVWRNSRHNSTGTHAPGGPILFEPGRLTLASLFQQNGYATAAVGKWHLGFGEDNKPSYRYDFSQEEIKPGPLEVGFDYFYGMAANVGNQPRIYIENHRFVGRKSGDVVKMNGRSDMEAWSPDAYFKEDRAAGDITKKAIEVIERAKDKPFFLYVATNIPHNGITPAPESLGKSECGHYGDFIQELDGQVGEIVEALKKADVLDNTLILFTSDNGGVVADNERIHPQFQAKQAGHEICGSFRGRKHSIYEGGFRVPFIVRWPGQVPQGRSSDAVMCLTDVFATCAAMLGKELPANAAEDSLNVLPLWRGEADAKGRDSVVLNSAYDVFAIREGDWKLIQKTEKTAVTATKGKKYDSENQNQLFNLAADPSETKNLWNANPEVTQRLTALLDKVKKDGRTRQ